eukprot:CAMPEP_0202689982 /NCGR_PEP_ID=MMETSP1385-20130828/5137_1 /ASSEMBLY_ACC=CAM_ASM_000861 /TAXON_ID=933848 /ORGANISM="Elphidium margaritaceum" /LENGTH=598 /DNA_ID=CAMNT_0049345203 /DNA_START=33 /DNA_END=1829 /DNA_ORIENTATION=+
MTATIAVAEPADDIDSKSESTITAETNGQTEALPKKKSRKRKLSDGSKNTDKNGSEPPTKKKKRGWTEEEETLYREGLQLYGRDYAKVAKHVGHDRNTAAIRSHSQIYFLKLLAQGTPLPPKVLESGNGYTLGGAALNKYSSIAIRHFGAADKVPMVDGVVSDQEAADKRKTKNKNDGNKSNTDGKDKKTKKERKKKAKKAKKKNKYYDSTDEDDDDDIYQEFNTLSTATQSSTRRSGRACIKRQRDRNLKESMHETEPYGLRTDIELYAPFVAPRAEETSEVDDVDAAVADKTGGGCKHGSARKKNKHVEQYEQPFEIVYCPNALLVADVHSHLCAAVEIMGLLGGTYDEAQRKLYVRKCYPIMEEAQTDQSVTADATDLFNVTERARNEDGLEVIGWYHSHPNFETYPSNTDCHQHYMQKYENELKQPYIGLIVGSWSTSDVFGGKSEYRFFNSIKEYQYTYTPLQFTPETQVQIPLHIDAAADDGDDDGALFQQIKQLVARYSALRYALYRCDFGEQWQDSKLTHGEKLLHSMRSHLQHTEQQTSLVESFIDKVKQCFMENVNEWWLTNAPQPKIDLEVTTAEDKENDANGLNDN